MKPLCKILSVLFLGWHFLTLNCQQTKPAQKVSNIGWDSIPHTTALPGKKTENKIEEYTSCLAREYWWNRVAAQQLTKEFRINHISSMARQMRDTPEQKYTSQMQVITIKIFVAAAHCSTIHIQHLHYNITRDHNPNFKFRMEGNREPRSGAKYLHGFFVHFSKSRFLLILQKGSFPGKTDIIFHPLQAFWQGI